MGRHFPRRIMVMKGFIRFAPFAVMAALIGCGGGGGGGSVTGGGPGPTPTPALIALGPDNDLYRLNLSAPGTLIQTITVVGLNGSELIADIEYRRSDGKVIAVTDESRVYEINPTTGGAVRIGTGPINPDVDSFIMGTDISPVNGRLRIITDLGQNREISLIDASVASNDQDAGFNAGDVNEFSIPIIGAIAYTGDTAGATQTTLFGIDSDLDILVRIGGVNGTPSPAEGGITTIGPLGVDTESDMGFDIVNLGSGDVAYAALTDINSIESGLFSVNLSTGAATSLGTIATGTLTIDFVILPNG